jgi:di/tricarboxylate transporter
MGYDPRGLVVAVMIAASAAFATPIGYQTNMLVYGPGGYRFTDFMKVGIPLNLSMGLLASAVIPLIWPLVHCSSHFSAHAVSTCTTCSPRPRFEVEGSAPA